MTKFVFSFLKKGWVITLLLSFFVLNSFYYDVLFAPNKHVFNPTGDGLKNYYTSAYFIRNNESLTSFEGMNYPYGESVLYTDGHPALSYLLKTLSFVIVDIDTNVIGILNTLMMLSFIITALIFYYIFKLLNVHKYFSCFSAIGLTFLTPQVFRLQGHYSLSYAFALPLTILMLLLFFKKETKWAKLSILLFINNVVWFFTHPYLGLMTTGLTILSSFFFLLIQKREEQKKSIKRLLLLGSSGFIALLLFLGVSNLLDNHEYRPTNPYGIHEYYATFESVFLPSRAPFKQNFQQFYEYEGTSWEGVSYIGLVSLVVIAIFLSRSIKLSFEKSKIILFNDWLKDNRLKSLVLSSIFFLMLSMLLPFRWGFEGFVDQFDSIKQFRAIGRFSWVFFYVIGICSTYIIDTYIHRLLEQKKNKLAYFLIIFVPFLYLSESFAHHREVSNSVSKSDNIFRLKRSPQEIKDAVTFLSARNYQAIIPLPYYHVGSDNYGKGGTDRSMEISMVLSFQTGLPITASHLARTSLLETRNLFQLFSENHIQKDVEKSINSDLPFLIIHTKESLRPNEIELLSRATMIKDYGSFSLYEITKPILFYNSRNTEKKRFETKEKLFELNGYWLSDTAKQFYHKSFDNLSIRKIKGYINSGKKEACKNYNVLFDTKNEKLSRSKEYEASVWSWTGDETNYYGQDNLNYRLFLEEQTEEKTDWIKIVSPSEAMTIDGGWSQIKFRFWAKKNVNYKIFLFGDSQAKDSVIFDEFLLKETSLDIYEKRGDQLLKNCQKITSN